MTIQAFATGILAPMGFLAGCYQLGKMSVNYDVRKTIEEQTNMIQALQEHHDGTEEHEKLIQDLISSKKEIQSHFFK
tara:strand:- start:217 stop:447 length:231 start_codon:yes stop_codon:yes gene_type:complete